MSANQPTHQTNIQNQQEQYVETIRKCLDVIVDQTQTVSQFKESVQFLASYRNVQIEFLQRLIAKLVVKNQSTTIHTEKSAILVDDVIEDTSIQFDQNYNYTSENVTNVSLIQAMSIDESVIELCLHKLASLILADIPEYEQAMLHEM